MIVVIYPQSLDFTPALELTFKCRNGEDCTMVQGLIEDDAGSVFAHIVGDRFLTEWKVGFIQAFYRDRNCQKNSSFLAPCLPDIQHKMVDPEARSKPIT